MELLENGESNRKETAKETMRVKMENEEDFANEVAEF